MQRRSNGGFPLPATLLAALLAAGPTPVAVLALDYRLEAAKRPLRIVPGCEAEGDEILVCGRRPPSFRIAETANTVAAEGRLFAIDIAPGVRLEGGGPKGSVGLGLKIAF